MKKAIGVMGITVLLLTVSLSRPTIIAKANCNNTQPNEFIINTQELPAVLSKGFMAVKA